MVLGCIRKLNSIFCVCTSACKLRKFSNIRTKIVFLLVFASLFILLRVVGINGDGTIVKVANCPLVTGGKCPDPRIRFYLYTTLNPTIPETIEYDEETSNLSQLNFNASLPTKFLTHGYNSGISIFDDLRREYLERGDYNIIVQEWTELAPSPCYLTAAHNVPFAGRCLAAVVRQAWAVGAQDLHLLGFSLGAHVPALAAHSLRPRMLHRITGLEPAMPLFVTSSASEKLDATDALFVDVVHTNALAQGKAERCGHIDFYMNGGVTQPGCAGNSGCNHHRALVYFTEAVRSEAGFWGWPCESILHYAFGLCPPRGTARIMGEDVDRRARGFYIVATNSRSPFAKGLWQAGPAEGRSSTSSRARSPLLSALRVFQR